MSSSFSTASAKACSLVHRRDIIEPVEIGHGLEIGLLFDQLFGAPVQEPDMRVDPGHHFSVQLKHQTQDTVGGGMLAAQS